LKNEAQGKRVSRLCITIHQKQAPAEETVDEFDRAVLNKLRGQERSAVQGHHQELVKTTTI